MRFLIDLERFVTSVRQHALHPDGFDRVSPHFLHVQIGFWNLWKSNDVFAFVISTIPELTAFKLHEFATPGDTRKRNLWHNYVYRTLIPVLVASRTASISLSYLGLNVKVKAQSIIRPEKKNRKNLLSFLSTIKHSCGPTLNSNSRAKSGRSDSPLIWVPKSIFVTSSYSSTVGSPALGV